MQKLEEQFIEVARLKSKDEKVKTIFELRDEVSTLKTFIVDAQTKESSL